MQRLIAILLFSALVLSQGCKVSEKIKGGSDTVSNVDTLVRNILRNNVSEEGFFIEKGKIRTTGPDGRISLFFNLKFKREGTYLISLRSTTGFEAFRIYINKDTVLINDRLNKVLLKGKPTDFEKITGMPGELLNLISGDFYPGRNIGNKETVCASNKAIYSGFVRGMMLNYELDCKYYKAKTLIVNSGFSGFNTEFQFKDYRKSGKYVPREINVLDKARQIKIEIEINKITYPWFGDITFTPGKDYEIRKL